MLTFWSPDCQNSVNAWLSRCSLHFLRWWTGNRWSRLSFTVSLVLPVNKISDGVRGGHDRGLVSFSRLPVSDGGCPFTRRQCSFYSRFTLRAEVHLSASDTWRLLSISQLPDTANQWRDPSAAIAMAAGWDLLCGLLPVCLWASRQQSHFLSDERGLLDVKPIGFTSFPHNSTSHRFLVVWHDCFTVVQLAEGFSLRHVRHVVEEVCRYLRV